MTNQKSSSGRTKDPVAIGIGKRIAQARKMAGFKTAKEFRKQLPKWPENRLSWYEAGYSMPHPNDVITIASVTGTSACWIMFGLGPIRSGERDLQAVRHQNFTYLHRQANETSASEGRTFLTTTKLNADQLATHLDNPFQRIGERLARRIEKAGGKARHWLDEQHVESDGLCASFPDDLRELMTIYSDMDDKNRTTLLEMARVLSRDP